MYIYCASRRGTRTLNASTDNLVLLGVFVVALFSHLPLSLLTAPVALLAVFLATEVFVQVRLLLLRARPLHREQAPAMVDMIHREAGALGVHRFTDQNARIYLVPTARQASAFVLGGLFPRLVVTGRLAVAASISPAPTEIIVRHELAHIANRDTRMWLLYVMLWPQLLLSLILGADSIQARLHPISFVLSTFASVAIGIGFTLFLFRRREYLADGLALNSTKDRDLYLRLLSGGAASDRSWFHPSREDRVAAMKHDSPVLRTNVLMILILVTVCIASLTYVVQANSASNEWGFEGWSLAIGSLLAFVFFCDSLGI
jgi:Zn-dependent protease with chaperone function